MGGVEELKRSIVTPDFGGHNKFPTILSMVISYWKMFLVCLLPEPETHSFSHMASQGTNYLQV